MVVNVAAGRPSKYDPAFCERVVEAGAEGMSLTEMAVAIGIARSTIYEWMDTYPDFSDAIKAGLEKSQAWWERNGRIATFGGIEGYNATSYIFQMKNRFPDDYRDRKELDHQSSDGSMKPTMVEFVTPNLPADHEGDD